MNKSFKSLFTFSILSLLSFIIYTFWSTGFFKTIDNKFDGQVLKEIKLKGAEDITISKIDSFAIISSTDRKSFPNFKQEYGNLYFLNLKNKKYDLINLTKNFKTPFAPHGISIFKKDSLHDYIRSSYGFWYHYIVKNQTDTITPSKEDVVSLTYDILDLSDQVLYSKHLLLEYLKMNQDSNHLPIMILNNLNIPNQCKIMLYWFYHLYFHKNYY